MASRQSARTIRQGDKATEPRDAPGGASVGSLASEELRVLVQGFIRSFGILTPGETPCGKRLGLSHAHALVVLLEQMRSGASPKQQDLGRPLGIDKSNITRLCRRMESAGHIVQEAPADDARARCLRLTSRGLRLALEVEQASRERFAQLLTFIPGSACKNLLQSIRILNEAVVAVEASEGRQKSKEEEGDR